MELYKETRHLLNLYKIKPNKKLGQNFCVNEFLLRRMIGYAGIVKGDVVVEIGAGLGSLTKLLSEKAGKVIAIEVDRNLVKALRDRFTTYKNIDIIRGDFLSISLPKFNKVVSNPPYSISSPIMFKLLKEKFDCAVLTFQKEFADRLVAKHGTKDYGRLTIMAYYKANIEKLEDVSEAAFYPSPEVKSCVVRIRTREKPPFEVLNEEFFSDFVDKLFTQRNKKTRTGVINFIYRKFKLNKSIVKKLIGDLPYLEDRPYVLAPEDLALLSNEVYKRFRESKRIFYKGYVFYVLPEVYEPSDDTFLLAENLDVKENEDVLDLGTGCGILAILASQNARTVVATDISPYAIQCAKINGKINNVNSKVEFRLGDLFQPIDQDEKYDLIIFNPPYLPTTTHEGKEWIEKAWTGGSTGRKIIDRFLNQALSHLKNQGRILILQSTLSNLEKTIKVLNGLGLESKVIANKKLEFESIALIKATKTMY